MGSTAAKQAAPGEAVEIFPHLYGGINVDAVVSELAVTRDKSGKFLSIQGI